MGRVSRRACFVALFVLPIGSAAVAQDFVVDYQIDAADVEIGDGLCRDHRGYCTLRAAVQEANAQPGQQTIALGTSLHYLVLDGDGEDAAATGDLDVTDDVIIEGVDADTTIVEAQAYDRVFDVAENVSLTLSDVTVRGGRRGSVVDSDVGGGLRAADGAFVVLSRAIFEDNAVLLGGGGIGLLGGTSSGATLLAAGSTFRRNGAGVRPSVPGSGGAIHATGHSSIQLLDCSLEDNVADLGAAIDSAFGAATIERSTIVGHQSGNDTLRFRNAEPVRIENSSIVDNASDLTIWSAAGSATTTFQNTTITGNTARIAIVNFYPLFADVRLRNSVLFNSVTEAECMAVESLGHNAIAAGSPGFCTAWGATDLIVADPLLGVLRDNGGSTRTRMPLAGSPLRDAGDDANCPALDQRRAARPQDGDGNGVAHCDIGAVEAPEPGWLGTAAAIAALALRARSQRREALLRDAATAASPPPRSSSVVGSGAPTKISVE